MKTRITNILILVAIIWAIFIINSIIPYNLNQLGIIPRNLTGLRGIIFAPFLHGDYHHIVSNTVPIAFLLFVTFTFYPKHALKVTILSQLIGSSLVWIFAREAVHIGISGLIYSLVAFLIIAGIYKSDFKSILVSIIIAFIYGGLIWGVLPTTYGISWEGHLFGALVGAYLGYAYYGKTKKKEKEKN
ncbi:MAG: rhomboid family intramembrane serine protease [Bacteroidales bacterium]|nr:rhomboid family intramembrane serine protease [Bacteroidales bacterium]